MRTISFGLKKAVMIAVMAIGVPAASVGAYPGAVILSGNFHTVQEGQVYRSAQLGKADFERVIAEHGVRSILNLRGPNVDKTWYRDEIAVAKEHGVVHYDVGLSARRRVPLDLMQRVVEILRQAPKPLLIHCRSGADRTGLVSALYRYAVEGKNADKAWAELSLRYGHFPWLTSRTAAMDQSFQTYQHKRRQRPDEQYRL